MKEPTKTHEHDPAAAHDAKADPKAAATTAGIQPSDGTGLAPTPLASTTLAGAKGLNDTFLSIAATTGMVKGMMFSIDNEYFIASSDAVGSQVPVLCGQRGSAQVAHNAGATVTWGLPSTFANVNLSTYSQGVSLA